MVMKKIALPIRFGIVISGLLIAFFLILALFKAHIYPIYSLFNAVITGFGIYEAIKIHKLKSGKEFTYTNGFSVGLVTGFTATIIFTLFFTFYATEIDTTFLTALLSNFKGAFDADIGLVAFVVAIMGLATTVVLTLSFMQLFKTSRNLNN
jgi:hypothetical protein